MGPISCLERSVQNYNSTLPKIPVQRRYHFEIFPFHHHLVFCLTTGSRPPPKRFLHIVRSRTSSFKWEYPLLSIRSSSSFLRLLPRLLVTSISPFIFPSITCFRRQFLRKMWPIQLAFRFLISCRILQWKCFSVNNFKLIYDRQLMHLFVCNTQSINCDWN
jgi:hypothetical protein